MTTRRIFAAIDISDEVRSRAAAYSAKLRSEFQDLRVRWERPEKLHITLRFVPKADDRMLTEFEKLIKSAAGQTSPFEIVVAGTGSFINRKGPTVLWLGITANSGAGTEDPLAELARALAGNDETRQRKFDPHLTLARIKYANEARDLIDRHRAIGLPPAAFPATEIVLYESTLERSGSSYSVILREKLRV